MNETLHAVLTGDIIQSRALDMIRREALADTLQKVYGCIEEQYGFAVPQGLAVFRGDSWQIYIEDPQWALQIAVQFEATLRLVSSLEGHEIDTKIALSVDTVDFINAETPGASDGAAFQKSGLALNNLKGKQQLVCVLPENFPLELRLGTEHLAVVTDYLMQTWTKAQARAVSFKLSKPLEKEPRQKEIASMWFPKPVSQPAVSRHLRAAHWSLLKATLERFREIINEIQSKAG